MKNYYELLGVAVSADPEEIKRAFRREIARYHPDKVQHLGPEFQEIASSRATALTEAYRVLMDVGTRRQYDREDERTGAPAGDPAHAAQPAGPTANRPSASPTSDAGDRPDSRVQQARETTSEFVRKASLQMLRDTIAEVAADAAELPARGFEAGYVVSGKRSIFGRKEPVVRLLARFVPQVNAAAIGDTWTLAMGATAPEQSGCVMLLGVGLAPSIELAAAVTDQRRKSRTAGPVIVPIDVRDWSALVPPEVPPPVRAVLARLKDGKG